MIGIFDSGLGGLTALLEFSKIMPSEDIVYFGDTGRVPYGSRSREIILKYASQDMRFLLTHDIDAVLIACGTVSSVALDILRDEYEPLPIVGVVSGAAKRAAEATKNGIIGVIATSMTINSGSYTKAIEKINPRLNVIGTACPLFVSLVENNYISSGDEVTYMVAQRYLQSIKESGADTLILGCTHFPIIAPIIQKVLPGVKLINSAKEAAIELSAIVSSKRQPVSAKGKIKYYISDTPQNFNVSAEIFLNHSIENETEKIDIERY